MRLLIKNDCDENATPFTYLKRNASSFCTWKPPETPCERMTVQQQCSFPGWWCKPSCWGTPTLLCWDGMRLPSFLLDVNAFPVPVPLQGRGERSQEMSL